MVDRIWIKVFMVAFGLSVALSANAAVDNLSFFHVTITTPWYLFIFLLGGVFSPFILMAVLAWYSAIRKSKREAEESGHNSSIE